jgi:hypothetical protein
MFTNILTNNTAKKTSNAIADNIAIQSGTADGNILQLNDNRPQAIAQRKIQETASNSPQVKQLRALQKMANDSSQVKQLGALQKMVNSNPQVTKTDGISTEKTIQGYFTLFGKKTNNETDFPKVDVGDLWLNLRQEFTRLGLSDTLIGEYQEFIMEWAMDGKRWTFETAKGLLAKMAAAKLKGEEAISSGSPTGMTSVVPELVGDKEKHTTARYTFTDASAAGGTANETLDLDKYTKRGESDLTAGTWKKEDILFAMRLWSLKAPLVQHLAQFVLPKLAKTDRKWEMYLREMERVLGERITEAKNKEFSIRSKDQSKTVAFNRSTFEVEARAKVQEKLLARTAPPDSQNDIPFFDDLIRAVLDKEGVSNWYTSAEGTQLVFDSQKIEKNPGMTLVHWRTILLFDWQVGNEIWKNGI